MYAYGHFVYDVESTRDQVVIANEAYYEGWSILLTDSEGRSHSTPARLGPAGLIEFDVPAGAWRVSLTYVTPYEEPALVAFWIAALVAMASALASLVRWIRRPLPGDASRGNDTSSVRAY